MDESGNTGTDWLNEDQPYFVYGGWFLYNDKTDKAHQYLKNILNNMQASELKSKNIFNNNKGYIIFKDIFEFMIDKIQAVPIFGIVDKKYMVAAKIVETFFDCAYNPSLNGYLTGPVELKSALANCIKNDNYLLRDFSTLIKNGTITLDNMENIKNRMICLFKNQNLQIVADTLVGLTTDDLQNMIDVFVYLTNNGSTKKWITLTQSTFIDIIKNIELLCGLNNIKVDIIHDNLRGYDEVLMEVKRNFFKDKIPEIMEIDNRIWLSHFPHIKSFSMEDSKNEILIQASDLLCGFISKIFKTIKDNGKLSDECKEIIYVLIHLRDFFAETKVLIWNYYSDYEFLPNLVNALGNNALFKENYIIII